jgi:hypothetical protein
LLKYFSVDFFGIVEVKKEEIPLNGELGIFGKIRKKNNLI